MSTIYNSSPAVHGVFSGGSCGITISRKSGGSTLSAGFLISGFDLRYGRQVSTQHHINVDGVTYMVGEAEGTLSISGLVGDKDAYTEILQSKSSDLDVCDPLTITITPNVYTSCSLESKPAKFICQGCISNQLALVAQQMQGGMIVASGSIQFQFNGLEIQ